MSQFPLPGSRSNACPVFFPGQPAHLSGDEMAHAAVAAARSATQASISSARQALRLALNLIGLGNLLVV